MDENRKLKNYIIRHFQCFFFVLGIIFIAISLLILENCYGTDILSAFFKEIGTFLLSVSVLTIAYEKWKDSKEKYYLMSEDKEFCYEINKIDFYCYKPQGKIMPILRQEELLKESYSLVNLIEKHLSQMVGYTIFIYGTTLSFLQKQEYKEAFKKAIKHGVNFELAIVNPHPNEADLKENEIRIKSQETLCVSVQKWF